MKPTTKPISKAVTTKSLIEDKKVLSLEDYNSYYLLVGGTKYMVSEQNGELRVSIVSGGVLLKITPVAANVISIKGERP